VVCGKAEADPDDPHAIVNPTLVVEVLSDSTEAYDRGEKAAHYRHLPSLREYVLVSQHRARIEVYRKNDAGRWELYEQESGSLVELASVGCARSPSTRCTAIPWRRRVRRAADAAARLGLRVARWTRPYPPTRSNRGGRYWAYPWSHGVVSPALLER